MPPTLRKRKAPGQVSGEAQHTPSTHLSTTNSHPRKRRAPVRPITGTGATDEAEAQESGEHDTIGSPSTRAETRNENVQKQDLEEPHGSTQPPSIPLETAGEINQLIARVAELQEAVADVKAKVGNQGAAILSLKGRFVIEAAAARETRSRVTREAKHLYDISDIVFFEADARAAAREATEIRLREQAAKCKELVQELGDDMREEYETREALMGDDWWKLEMRLEKLEDGVRKVDDVEGRAESLGMEVEEIRGVVLDLCQEVQQLRALQEHRNHA